MQKSEASAQAYCIRMYSLTKGPVLCVCSKYLRYAALEHKSCVSMSGTVFLPGVDKANQQDLKKPLHYFTVH